MKAMWWVGAILLVVVMNVPSTVAVHGSPYTAKGIAYVSNGMFTPVVAWLGPLGVPAGTDIYDATVVWGGFWSHTYTVTITDPTTGQVLVNAQFPGMEQWGCCVYGNYEFFQYHGCAASGWTCVETPNFDLYGLQSISVQTGQTFMLYEGWYKEYALVLVVDSYLG